MPPLAVPPSGKIVVTLQFTPGGEEFEQHATIYVEETVGFRPLEITVKSAQREPASCNRL
jgi:hypothetical protein